jgi:hypothetical protein
VRKSVPQFGQKVVLLGTEVPQFLQGKSCSAMGFSLSVPTIDLLATSLLSLFFCHRIVETFAYAFFR